MIRGQGTLERSQLMARIRCRDTAPELLVRKLVTSHGHRYRLNVGRLPGRPDLVFHRPMKIIFVHGCFWHRHCCRRGRSFPASNRDFWQRKFENNRKRDRLTLTNLRKLGWSVLVVWECDTRNLIRLNHLLQSFLGPPHKQTRLGKNG